LTVLAGRRVFDEEVAVQRAADRVVLRQAEEGTAVAEVCRKAGISEASFYNWRKKYGGLMPSEMRRLKQLDEENVRLKRLVADLSLDKEMLQDVIRRKI
jgi:putative transposase